MTCAEMSDAVESIFVDGWTDSPALRAVPEDRRERLESALESLLASHDRTRAVVSGEARVVPLGGGERPGTSGGRDPVTPPRGSDGATGSGADAFALDAEAIPDAVLSEHFGYLQMLHRQLLNAVAEFRPGRDADAPGFAYADETEDVVGTTGAAADDGDGAAKREDGALGRTKSDGECPRMSERRRRRLVVPAAGLSRRALEDVSNAAQWIAGVSEGAARVLLAACQAAQARWSVDAIIIGGAGLAGLAQRLQPDCETPLIDSVEAGARRALALAQAGPMAPSQGFEVAWQGMGAAMTALGRS